LTFDGVWNYHWDAENRLISMDMTNAVSGIAATNRLKLTFAYCSEYSEEISTGVTAGLGAAFDVDGPAEPGNVMDNEVALAGVIKESATQIAEQLGVMDWLSDPNTHKSIHVGQEIRT
jgi:hypothetical protein